VRELLACPFCGSRAETFLNHAVSCTGCSCSVHAADRNDAVTAWNRRAAPAQAVEGVVVNAGWCDRAVAYIDIPYEWIGKRVILSLKKDTQ
jgi:hypothetical protein